MRNCGRAIFFFALLAFFPLNEARAANEGDPCTVEAKAWVVADTDPTLRIQCDGTQWRAIEKIDESGAATSRIKKVITLGDDPTACSADLEGTIRYNSTQPCIEFCNGAVWACISPVPCGDTTPDAFNFTDLANQTVSTLVTSNIVQIGGLGCPVTLEISGTGSPQYRTCTDGSSEANCDGSVLYDWTSSPGAIDSGQYVQLRLTTSAAGGDTYSANLSVGNAADVWNATTTGDCTGSPAVGTVCADGTVYAGLSPDGSVKMYVTRCDAGMSWDGSACTGSRWTLSWNNGTLDPPWTVTGCNNANSGETNTTCIAGTSDAGDPYLAGEHCDGYDDGNGNTDWYLPAKSELAVIYGNEAVIGNFDTSGTYYWSSSENTNNGAWRQRFSDGHQTNYTKSNPNAVRCARR